jgi:uncharacterized protein (DUF697 family)
MDIDWNELDRKADWIIRKYAVVAGVWNILPPPLDIMGATGTFSKMATELAGVYQVVMPGSRARQIGVAMATGTASVLGVAYAGSKLVKLIPGAGLGISALIQGPMVALVAYAAGETLKDYFRKSRAGLDLTIVELKDSFVKILSQKIGRPVGSTAITPVPHGASFCPYCGNRLVTGAAFCSRCGERQPGAP